jgi:hypothetical protein
VLPETCAHKAALSSCVGKEWQRERDTCSTIFKYKRCYYNSRAGVSTDGYKCCPYENQSGLADGITSVQNECLVAYL